MRSGTRYRYLILRMALDESRAAIASVAAKVAHSLTSAITVLLVGSVIVFAPAYLGLGKFAGLAIIVAGALLSFAWIVARIPARLYWLDRLDEADRESTRMLDAQLRSGRELYERALRSVGLDLDAELIDQCDEWCRQTEAILARVNEKEHHAFAAVDAEERARIVDGTFTYQGLRRIDLRRIAMKKRLDSLKLITAKTER